VIIANWAQERGIELDKTETYVPPFDDVFVALVSKLDGSSGGDALAD
jgi:hypothetical protein